MHSFEKDNPEFLASLEVIATEKGLEKKTIIKALESGLENAFSAYFKNLYKLTVKIKNTGAISVFKRMKVVESVSYPNTEITLEDALKKGKLAEKSRDEDNEIRIGSEVLVPQSISEVPQYLYRNMKELIGSELITREKEAEFIYFQNHQGIKQGVVKQKHNSRLLIGIDKYEAFINQEDMLPGEFERAKPGDRIEALVKDIIRSNDSPQVYLTRTSNEFLEELLTQFIPEIQSGPLEIKGATRDPGSRSKVAVISRDSSVDPAMLCHGNYGDKLAEVSRKLGGEQIDIIEWNEDQAIFAMNALKERFAPKSKFKTDPINIINITADYTNKTLDIVVSEISISKAIGRKGQNIKLIANLLEGKKSSRAELLSKLENSSNELSKSKKWTIHLVTPDENSQKKLEEFIQKASIIENELNVDDTVAQLLVVEGLDSVEKIAAASINTLVRIEGFNVEIAENIQERATDFLVEATRKKDDDLINKAGYLTSEIGIPLEVGLEFVKVNILDKNTLADLSVIEVIEDYALTSLDEQTIKNAIFIAKQAVYKI